MEAQADGVKRVEILRQRAYVDEPADEHVGQLHKQPVAAHIDNKGAEPLRGLGGELSLEKLHLLEKRGIFLRIGRHPFGGGNVLGHVREMFDRRLFPGQHPVHEQVGVTPDRAGEMGVIDLGQAVVAQGGHVVNRPFEALQERDLQCVFLRGPPQRQEQLLHFTPLREIPHPHPVTRGKRAELLQPLHFRVFVDAIDRGNPQPFDLLGHGFIGRQHAFLDELVGDVVLDLLQADRTALLIEPDFDLGEIEIERPLVKPFFAKQRGQLPRRADAFPELGGDIQGNRFGAQMHLASPLVVGSGRHGLPLQNRVGLPVGEPGGAVDHRPGKTRRTHVALVVELEERRGRQPIHPRLEAAHPVAQTLGQHRHDTVRQVSGVAPGARLPVQRAPGPHVMRHVGDVHAELPAARRPLHVNGVVEIFGVIRVDGEDELAPQILPVGGLPGVDLLSNPLRLAQHILGELLGQMVFPEDGKHVHSRVTGQAEALDDFALGIHVAALPGIEPDHHFFTHRRRPWKPALGGVHVHVVRKPGVIGDDIKELFGRLQRAHHGGVGSLQNPDHAPLDGRSGGALAHALVHEPHHHFVAVHGGGGVGLGDE